MTGRIDRLMIDKGFGFIKNEGGVDFFFHRTALKNIRFEDLKQGQFVDFEESETSKGLRAEDVYIR